MKRGVSPVINTAILVLISVVMVSIFYGWATMSTTTVSGAMSDAAEYARDEILSDVTIITPAPAQTYDTNQPVIIHNSGSIPLTKMNITYIESNGSGIVLPEATKISLDGNVDPINANDWPIQVFHPGEVVIFWLPPGNYDGDVVMVTARGFISSKEVGVP